MAGGGVDGLALGSIFAGSLFLYAALQGKTILGSVKALIQGKSPATSASANQIPIAADIANAAAAAAGSVTLGGAGGGGGGGGGGSPNTAGAAPVSGSESSWISAFLSDVGAPATSANVASVGNWIAHEKPPGNWSQWNNPLNVGAPGSPVPPVAVYPAGPGIAEYASLGDGAHAAAEFLIKYGYNQILLLLRGGRGLKSGAESDLSRWSGGGYSSV